MSIKVTSKDEIIMRLVHYFVTEEDYHPIIVNGVKNEIWLENLSAPYRIIRINSNYIHNEEQLSFDNYKVKSITKQIKKKTLSLKLNTLNILLDLNDGIQINKEKNIDTLKINDLKDVRKDNFLTGMFPKLKTFSIKKENSLDLIVNITNDINNKTEKDNAKYEKVFAPKKIIITNILIIINVIMFCLSLLLPEIENTLILSPGAVKAGEYWRLLTASFLHADVVHLVVNMYSLSIIGTQVENFLGKFKYLLIYLFSTITGSLLSCILTQSLSLGASGAIFGLMGCLVYFGYHYRLYLGKNLRTQLLPVILLNLSIGFLMPYIDNAGHIGGLIGGGFITMALGIEEKDEVSNKINGIIISIVYIGFLLYLLFFK